MTASQKVDEYMKRSTQWPEVIAKLRPILRGCGLDEAIKWGKPCYSHDGKNILILQEMKPYLSVMFFKGALIDDTSGVLESQGPNTRSALRMCFTKPADVTRLRTTVQDYVEQAIAIEAAGLDVGPAPKPKLADELTQRMRTDKAFKKAFDALTPGRQREYRLHIAEAKQPATRAARVEKCAPKILAGKGFRDR